MSDSLLADAIEYHDGEAERISGLLDHHDPEVQDEFNQEEHDRHVELGRWLRELSNLRNRVGRHEDEIEGYRRLLDGRDVKVDVKGVFKRERELATKLERCEEVLDSAHRQNRNLIDANIKLKDQKAALADVIADLKLDLKARE
jgi:hypothetical protein